MMAAIQRFEGCLRERVGRYGTLTEIGVTCCHSYS